MPRKFKTVTTTIDELDPRLGKPKRAALDNGYFSIANIEGLLRRLQGLNLEA